MLYAWSQPDTFQQRHSDASTAQGVGSEQQGTGPEQLMGGQAEDSSCSEDSFQHFVLRKPGIKFIFLSNS